MTTITVTGNATGDPELRFTPSSGKPVATFTLADNHRRKEGDQWVDDGTTFYKVTCWRDAEAIADKVTKGMRVIVSGDLRNKPWEDRQGSKRDSMEISASTVGIVVREARQQPARQGQGWRQPQDPWAQQSQEAPF